MFLEFFGVFQSQPYLFIRNDMMNVPGEQWGGLHFPYRFSSMDWRK